MMRPVEPWEWELFIGTGLAMPEDVTREEMWAAVDAIREIELQEEAVQGLGIYGAMLERLEKRAAELKPAIDPLFPEIERDYNHVLSSIKSVEEILKTYRSWLI